MRIVVDVNHPAHIHYFKHFIWEMQRRGHEFLITASDKEISYRLLDVFGFDYTKLGNYGGSLVQKIVNLPLLDLKMVNAIRGFSPDVCMGAGSIRAAHAAFFLHTPSILLEDTEHSKEQHLLYLPFVSTILTPSCFKKEFGKKQIRFDGYNELAYLHPDRFTPDPAVLAGLGLTADDRFIVVRLVSWQASHDLGQHGIRDTFRLVRKLEEYGRVLITSESPLPPDLEPYRIRISPEQLHDLLYFATLYIGEGATTASECAVLGTHALYVNTLGAGTISEQEERYALVFTFSASHVPDDDVIRTAIGLLGDPELRRKGKVKRDHLLKEKIDVTSFLVWFVEHYPLSHSELAAHPEIRHRFKEALH